MTTKVSNPKAALMTSCEFQGIKTGVKRHLHFRPWLTPYWVNLKNLFRNMCLCSTVIRFYKLMLVLDPEYSLEGLMLKLQYLGHLMWRADSLEKIRMLGKTEGGMRRGWHDKMAGWHHRLNGHEFEKTPGDSEGQGSLACCSPWGHKELDTTDQLNNKTN